MPTVRTLSIWGQILPSTGDKPVVTIDPGFIPDARVPAVSITDADRSTISRTDLIAAACAFAHQLRPNATSRLPIEVEISVVVENDVEVFHYGLAESQVSLRPGEAAAAQVKITLQRAVDFLLLKDGVSLLTIIAAGRSSLMGSMEDILEVFGYSDYPARAGRRAFKDLTDLLLKARAAKPREIGKLVNEFGLEDFVRELLQSVTESVILSGMPHKVPAATVKATIADLSYLIRIAPELTEVRGYSADADYSASIEIPKVDTAIDRLLGRITDIEALMQRKILLSGPAVDNLMPLFERISSGLSGFTFPDEVGLDWSFPPARI
jgi:hypothetical protein